MGASVQKKTRLSAAERKQDIIRAATEVFSRHGFRGTTLRRLARQAEVSESMIYHHFPSKEALYDAMLQKKIDESRHLYFPMEAARAKHDRGVLETIAGNFIQQQTRDSSFMRMLLFSALEGHELARKFVQGPLQEFFHFLGSYLDERANDGDLKSVDGQVAARLLLGMVFYLAFLREILQDPGMQRFDIDHLTRTTVDLFFEGVRGKERDEPSGRDERG